MTDDRTQRRFARRQWSRRWLALRYVVAAVVLVALVGGGVWAVWFSSLLDVEEVRVGGTVELSSEEVQRAAAVPDGEPLATVDLDAVRARVQSLAFVRSAEVTRSWPHAVVIEVRERVAIAVVQIGSTLRGMDETGELFRGYAQPPPGLPRVLTDGAPDTEALVEAGRVITALPDDLAARVEHVEVASIDEISLALPGGRTVVWGSAEDSAAKAEVLAVLLDEAGADVTAYDVSVPARPTTR